MPRFNFERRRRPGRSVGAVLIYLVGFLLLVTFISNFYLIPATRVFGQADPQGRRLMAADAMLILTLVLFLLFVGLLMTFRVGRFFRPRRNTPNKPTKYVDAWKESGRRLKTPDSDE